MNQIIGGLICIVILIGLLYLPISEIIKEQQGFKHITRWGEADYWVRDPKKKINNDYWERGGYVWVEEYKCWLPNINKYDIRHEYYFKSRGYTWSETKNRWIKKYD
jgi:hypothetical protein